MNGWTEVGDCTPQLSSSTSSSVAGLALSPVVGFDLILSAEAIKTATSTRVITTRLALVEIFGIELFNSWK